MKLLFHPSLSGADFLAMTQSQGGPAPEPFLLLADLIIYKLSQSKDWRKLRWDQFWSLLTHARPRVKPDGYGASQSKA
jgi:hypothetical protein